MKKVRKFNIIAILISLMLSISLMSCSEVDLQKSVETSQQQLEEEINNSIEQGVEKAKETIEDTVKESVQSGVETTKESVQNSLEEGVQDGIDSITSIFDSIGVDSPNEEANTSTFEGYKLIEVDGGDLSGQREPNVVVDIGFGDREYYAFTNEYGQLVKVIAKEIILQDDSTEPVTSSGRYYSDEAKVPGVESSSLDEGHVIADSLGGVSNAYNITPQDSTLNRHGNQAYMEKVIRDANGCTDFVAIITYPNTNTQIPSHYSYTYTINGSVIRDEFDNINPEEY